MQMVDTIKCVYCGAVKHRMSKGKNARTLSGVCDMCLRRKSVQEELFSETKEDESEEKSKGVQKGRSSAQA